MGDFRLPWLFDSAPSQSLRFHSQFESWMPGFLLPGGLKHQDDGSGTKDGRPGSEIGGWERRMAVREDKKRAGISRWPSG